jgi:hypothetical protein
MCPPIPSWFTTQIQNLASKVDCHGGYGGEMALCSPSLLTTSPFTNVGVSSLRLCTFCLPPMKYKPHEIVS